MNESRLSSLIQRLPQDFTSQEYRDLGRGTLYYPVDLTIWGGSVLCLLVEDGFFYIQRSELVPRHKGQLAMIGGLKKPGEVSPIQVIQREYTEETGLEADSLEVLGLLPPVHTNAKTLVIPVMGRSRLSWKEFSQKVVSNGEWTHGVWVSFDFLAHEEHWTYAFRYSAKGRGTILFCGLHGPECKVHSCVGQTNPGYFLLWGASARVSWNVMRLYFS